MSNKPVNTITLKDLAQRLADHLQKNPADASLVVMYPVGQTLDWMVGHVTKVPAPNGGDCIQLY